MSNALFGTLTLAIVGGSVAVLAAIAYGLQRALNAAKWPHRDRIRATLGIMALLSAWFVAALLLSTNGFFRTASFRIPTIQYGLLIPIVGGLILFWRWPLLKRAVEAVPQEWLVSLQVYRVEGALFLLVLALGLAPAEFALPAGIGDIAVGLLAPIAGIVYARRQRDAAAIVRAWNFLGLTDLIVALTTGFLSAPSQLQRLAFDRPNTLIGAFPLVIIPVFLVPLSILLHLASLYKLRQTHAAPQIGTTRFAAERT